MSTRCCLAKYILTAVDWKCQIRIYDQSIQDDPDAALQFSIFRPEKDMPDARCGDVVMVLAAKVSQGVQETRNTSDRFRLKQLQPGPGLSVLISIVHKQNNRHLCIRFCSNPQTIRRCVQSPAPVYPLSEFPLPQSSRTRIRQRPVCVGEQGKTTDGFRV